ncbi:MAG: dephospho-CoA kinase, partial [Muribaculaceae bacterium]|nr:dephospho-CoA kinase [Muribaculaceae bacterium]
RVFDSDEERLWLNSLVHQLVRVDVAAWHDALIFKGQQRCFVESAILVTSGLAEMCDEIWMVTASEDVRIARISSRDSLDEEAIRKRIRSQEEEEQKIDASEVRVRIIDNSGRLPLLPQI